MSSWPVLVFDIESIPDVAGLRSLRQMDASVDDAAVYDAEIADRAARGKGDFMPLYLQRVLVISCVFRNAEGLRVHSLVDREAGGASQEGRVIQSFFNLIERHEPQLVSWNGSGFDLPVLHYRGMRHGVVASKYWDMGDDDREYRYNNYISRYHLRHLDLMDLMALYQPQGQCAARRHGQALRLSRQARHGRQPGVRRLQGRAHRRDPALLRNRRDEHLPAVLPLPADARRLQRRRVPSARSPRCGRCSPGSTSRTGASTCGLAGASRCRPRRRRLRRRDRRIPARSRCPRRTAVGPTREQG